MTTLREHLVSMNPTQPQSEQQGGTTGTTVSRTPFASNPIQWCRENPTLLTVIIRSLALSCNITLILLCVFHLISISFNIRNIILDVYLIAFGFLAVVCELRFIDLLRKMTYPIFKWFYFLTLYQSRAIAYIFVGILIIQGSIWSTIVGIVFIATGILWLVGARFIHIKNINDSHMLPKPVDTDIGASSHHQREQQYYEPPEVQPSPAPPAAAPQIVHETRSEAETGNEYKEPSVQISFQNVAVDVPIETAAQIAKKSVEFGYSNYQYDRDAFD